MANDLLDPTAAPDGQTPFEPDDIDEDLLSGRSGGAVPNQNDRKERFKTEMRDRARQHLRDEIRKIKQGSRLTNKAGGPKSAAIKGQGSKLATSGEQAASKAGAEAAKAAGKAAAQAIKAASKAAVQGLRTAAAATIEIWGPILLIILVIIIIIGIVIALFGLGGITGKGGNITPSTPAEKYAAVTALALANDPQAKQEVVVTEVDKLKVKLVSISNSADQKYGTGSEKAGSAKAAVNEINLLLEDLIAKSANPTARAPVIEQINQKIQEMQNRFPELFFTAGTCADLKPFIDSGQFSAGNQTNMKLIIAGQMKNIDGQIWPASQDMCKALLIALNAGYSIWTGTFSMGHSKKSRSGYISRHYCGAAIDIGRVNGKAVNNSNPDVGALAKLWFEAGTSGAVHIGELIVPSSFNQYAMKNNKKFSWSSEVQRGHQGHIHLAGRVVKTECQQQ